MNQNKYQGVFSERTSRDQYDILRQAIEDYLRIKGIRYFRFIEKILEHPETDLEIPERIPEDGEKRDQNYPIRELVLQRFVSGQTSELRQEIQVRSIALFLFESDFIDREEWIRNDQSSFLQNKAMQAQWNHIKDIFPRKRFKQFNYCRINSEQSIIFECLKLWSLYRKEPVCLMTQVLKKKGSPLSARMSLQRYTAFPIHTAENTLQMQFAPLGEMATSPVMIHFCWDESILFSDFLLGIRKSSLSLPKIYRNNDDYFLRFMKKDDILFVKGFGDPLRGIPHTIFMDGDTTDLDLELLECVRDGRLQDFFDALEAGASIDTVDPETGETVGHIAAKKSEGMIITFLYENGTKIAWLSGLFYFKQNEKESTEEKLLRWREKYIPYRLDRDGNPPSTYLEIRTDGTPRGELSRSDYGIMANAEYHDCLRRKLPTPNSLMTFAAGHTSHLVGDVIWVEP